MIFSVALSAPSVDKYLKNIKTTRISEFEEFLKTKLIFYNMIFNKTYFYFLVLIGFKLPLIIYFENLTFYWLNITKIEK